MNLLKNKLIYIRTMAAGILLAATSGCFTGIESTPGISKSEVKRQNAVKPSDEQRLMEPVIMEPFAKWHPGKRFVVTDPKISIALTPADQASALTEGDVIVFEAMRPVLTVMGDSLADLQFRSPRGEVLTYRSEMAPEAMRVAKRVFIPFTVEETMIQLADSVLNGRKLYLLTSHRNSADGKTPVEAAKFVPVTITAVKSGNTAFPLRVMFADETGTQFSTFLNPDTPTHTTRAFHRLFSLSDPRKNYPDISDHVWQNITLGKVELDMTREECRLALGAPAEVDREFDISTTTERWSYPDGRVLIFEEGILSNFR